MELTGSRALASGTLNEINLSAIVCQMTANAALFSLISSLE
ncbi:hypothetical protein MGWOODY_Tha3009 [hydrothermal vent metagenome]|uniref:Uncharacterized protein n=1 Tax=hydrothermal vent metagenome TaxID=652676 RepID=A0A160TDB7_9ZZZZ